MYTLDDLYVIFRQEPTAAGKLELLEDWQGRGFGFQINWSNLIKVWSGLV